MCFSIILCVYRVLERTIWLVVYLKLFFCFCQLLLPSFYRNCIFHICSVALAEIGRIFTREGAAKVQLFLKYADEY